uniref:long-chain-fatty-acid--CoA ligase n=1 Tax=Sinocyclocheilus anshuiensis TaxID=1608454 RepID=A0A671KY27_9TELE
MQAHELLKQLRIPELSEVRDYFRSLSTNILLGMGVFTAVTAYWVATRPKALKAPCDLRMQSVELPGGEFARRGAVLNGGPLLSHFYEDAKTMYECFHRGLRESKNGPCLGSRKPKQPYEWLSYSEVIERAENLGSAFLHKGHSKDGDPYIGIFSQNRPEWTISELACYTYSLISVPLYDTLGTEAIIIDFTGISTVVCDVPEKAKLLLDCVSGRQHSVKTLILMENFDTDLVSRAQQCGIDIISLRDAEVNKPQLVCSNLCLTPVNAIDACVCVWWGMFIYGQAHSPLKRHILEFAFRRKENEMKSGIMRRDSVWDKIIFKKVQASVGGHVRLMITGAAPVSAPVLTFLRAALGCHFYEGYGQTECTAGSTTTLPGDWTAGHVGAPLPCNDIKLVDVGEMNYYATKGEGEVCVRGPNVFKGYLKDPEKTKEALGEDGWVHTGDIGRWLPNGTLKIVDRKKHIFKLAQGEYIAPEKIENIYIRSEAVAQAFVHGDSLQACLVAIIVPDPDFLPGWAKKRGIEGSYEELCKNKEVKKAILEDIVKLGKESGLKSFEQVKDIALHTEMFSIQNGLLTPTLKAKRADLRNCFRNLIDELYSNTQM